MSTALLEELKVGLNDFCNSGETNLMSIFDETESFILQLKEYEAELEREDSDQSLSAAAVDSLKFDDWYKGSIKSLKSYNGTINRFSKNFLHNAKFSVNIDEAYTYPLNLDSVPVMYSNKIPTGMSGDELLMRDIKLENQQELMKAIILHLLKIGQSDLIKEIINEYSFDNLNIDSGLLNKFGSLNDIVDDIVLRHSLTSALDWFETRTKEGEDNDSKIEFKFHILQYVLLLNGEDGTDPYTLLLEAYRYSNQHLPRFFKEYIDEISPIMTLALFTTNKEQGWDDLSEHFSRRTKEAFSLYEDKVGNKKQESKFIEEILNGFSDIKNNQHIFQSLANEFISFYCKDMKLSNDSSLFQGILSGFINLPSFYKYNKIERKFRKLRLFSETKEPDVHFKHMEPTDNNDLTTNNLMSNIIAPYSFDLPFQLPDANRFLFKYHPIFICPVSKEQLIPLTINERSEFVKRNKKPRLGLGREEELYKTVHNPVVVLKYCNHVALKESIWQLSKRGSEVFKCHYCYKKHKFSEVKEAYFIDL